MSVGKQWAAGKYLSLLASSFVFFCCFLQGEMVWEGAGTSTVFPDCKIF